MLRLSTLLPYLLPAFALANPPAPVPVPEPPAPCNGMGPGVTVRVACTGYCSDAQVAAVSKAADQMKLKVQFVVLMDDNGRPKFDLSDPDKNFDAIISPGGWDTLPGYFAALGPDNSEKKELRAHMEDLFCTQKLGKTGAFTQKRDNFEFNFDVDTYLKNDRYRDIPFFAACYGMQMMGAALGMPEYVDIQADLNIPNRSKVTDSVTVIDRSSNMGRIFPSGTFSAYENHHQGLHLAYYNRHKQDFPNLKVVAVSNNNRILEGIELRSRLFVGTQFHPEDSSDDVKLPVYHWLLEGACKHMKRAGRKFTLAGMLAKFQRPPPVPAGASEKSTYPAVMGCPTPTPNPSQPSPGSASPSKSSTITGG